MPLTKPFKLGPFKLGMNNRRPETDLRTKDGNYLRSAVNVDIDSTGRVSRRAGVVRKITGVDCHSLWSDSSHAFTYYVDGTTMFRILLNGSTVSVRTGLTPGQRVSYDFGNLPGIFWSNGFENGRVIDNINGPWSMPLPPHGIGLAAVPNGGTLPGGTYRLYIVYTTADGQESGSSDAQPITLTDNPGLPLGTGGTRNDDEGGSAILLTGLPTSLPSGITGVTLYMTPPGSEVYYRVGSVGISGTYTVTATPDPDLQGRTLGLAPLPVGTITRYYNGRMLSVVGSVLFYSEAYTPGLYDPGGGYIEFLGAISLVMPMKGGVYVVADQTYWIPGELKDALLEPLLPYGGVPHSDAQAIDQSSVYWMSVRGVVVGDDDGKVSPVQEDNVAVDGGDSGASLMREADGVRQLIASTFGVDSTGVAATSYMSAEIIRKGTSL